MYFLGLALYAEGPTDYYFLRPLLLRLCEDICLRDANQTIEFAEEVIALNHPDRWRDAPRAERIVAAAREALGAWRIVFVHTDGAGNADRGRADCVQPALDQLHQAFAAEGVGVAVIPVRETESWAIADGDAIRQVFGTTLDDVALGLPPTAAVESIIDPKKRLNDAYLKTAPSSRQRRQGVAPKLYALGESVSLSTLRQLKGFKTLEAELREGLRNLGILR